MYRYLILALFCGSVNAHEWTPTYPVLKQSYVEGIIYTTMTLFNVREDVTYYEVGVFDEDWGEVPFSVTNKIMFIKHLERKKIEVYIREKDKDRAKYICSISKLVVKGGGKTSFATRICSKIK